MWTLSLQDFVCPQCLDGFIEELPESSHSPNQHSEDQDESQFMRGVFNDFSMGPFQMAAGNNNTPYFRIANEILGPIITGSLGGGLASTSRYEDSHWFWPCLCNSWSFIHLAQTPNLPTEVQVAMAQIKQMVDDEVKDAKGQLTLKTYCKKFSYPSQTEQILVVLQCSSWEIQVSNVQRNKKLQCLSFFCFC